MSEFSLTKPRINENCERYRYIVYIVKEGLITGISGKGNTPQEATEQAKIKIEAGEAEV